jgi:hypothetical protein
MATVPISAQSRSRSEQERFQPESRDALELVEIDEPEQRVTPGDTEQFHCLTLPWERQVCIVYSTTATR